jgi:hypothetical protein
MIMNAQHMADQMMTSGASETLSIIIGSQASALHEGIDRMDTRNGNSGSTSTSTSAQGCAILVRNLKISEQHVYEKMVLSSAQLTENTHAKRKRSEISDTRQHKHKRRPHSWLAMDWSNKRHSTVQAGTKKMPLTRRTRTICKNSPFKLESHPSMAQGNSMIMPKAFSDCFSDAQRLVTTTAVESTNGSKFFWPMDSKISCA